MGPLSAGELLDALGRIGADPKARARLVRTLRELEPALQREGVNVREEITGPLVDALHQRTGVIQKTLKSGVEISCRYQSKIVRDFVMAEEHPDHVWEPQTTKLLLALAPEVEQAVIGGAYFGDHAILLAREMAAGGVCHCFELNADQLEMLRHNARQNGLDNLVLNATGLWRTDGVRLVLDGDDSHASPREVVSGTPDAFAATSVDSYGATRGLARLDLIMLDIEGGELEALRGATRYLEQPVGEAPVVIFEIHRAYVDWSAGLDQTEPVRFLIERGYRVFAIRDYQGNVSMEGRPVELVALPGVYLEGPPHGFNMLAVKDEGAIERYGLRVCTGVSPKLLFHRDPALHQPLH